MEYTKHAITIEQQVRLLQERGLAIDNVQDAHDALYRISYFRLADYWRPMEANHATRRFQAGADFHTVLTLYRFDTELKRLLFQAIQEIEIAMRTRINHHFSLLFGPFWFMDASLFSNQSLFSQHQRILRRDLQHSNEDYIMEHWQRYDSPDMPPSWKTLEVTTFGLLSRLYSNFADPTAKHVVARSLGIRHYLILRSWMVSLATLRNYCAHHARVWNRLFPVPPTFPADMPSAWINNQTFSVNKIYPQLCCIAYLLNSIDPQNTFATDMKALLAKYPTVNPSAMGFVQGWECEPLWQ